MGSLQPQDMSYFDVAPVTCSATIECAAAPRAVFDVLADHRNWPAWIGMGVRTFEPTSTAEAGIGSTRMLTIGPRLLRVHETFIAWDEPTVGIHRHGKPTAVVSETCRGFLDRTHRCRRQPNHLPHGV